MTVPKFPVFVLTSLMLSAGLGSAQMNHANHGATAVPSTGSPAANAFHREMTASMAKMHEDMTSAPMTGNPDIDFAEMMIPHHQGAIDMAKIQLKYGKDPALRTLADEIITAQEKEIVEMRQRIRELKAANPQTTSSVHKNH